MFLDTTSISDSTLSSSTLPSSSISTSNNNNNNSTCTKISQNNSYNQPPVNEPSDCLLKRLANHRQSAELSSVSHTCGNKAARKGFASLASSSLVLVLETLLESLWRIKSWLGASIGALWATLSFINHFIESQPTASSSSLSRSGNSRSLAEEVAGDSRRLAWREISMISFPDNHNNNRQQQPGTYSLATSSVEIDPVYLSVVNRARKWSEEAAFVLSELSGQEHENSNNSSTNRCWASCSYGSLLYTSSGNSNNNNNSQLNSAMDQQHRGRVVQRADSQYNKPGSLSTPLALPLHSLVAGPQATYTDALQIRGHATPSQVPVATSSITNKCIRTYLSGCVAQQQQQRQRQHRTPTDFQGRPNACCSLGAGPQEAPSMREHGFGQHKHHHKQQEQQQQQQQHLQHQQRNDQTPLEQRLELSRALLGMQKPKDPSEYGDCVLAQRNEDTFGPLGLSRPESGCNQFCSEHHQNVQRNHQISNSNDVLEAADNSSSSLVLVSKSALSNLTEQVAFSMNKMKDLEEKVRIIPELQRRLHSVISDSASTIAGSESRSSSIGLRDSKCSVDNNNDPDHINYTASSGSNTRGASNNIPRRGSLNDSHEAPYKAMFSSSLRKPYGGSMRYSPGFRASNILAQQPQSGADLVTASSLSISSPYTNGQRCFDKLTRSGNINGNHNSSNIGTSRQSLDISNVLRSTHASLNSSSNLGPSSKVEYEDLINDLISLSYSVNYLSSNSNSAHSQSSSGNQSQVKETHGNKLEPHDAIRTSKPKRHNQFETKNQVNPTEPSSSSNTYHRLHSDPHYKKTTFNSSMNHIYNQQHHARDNNNSHHSTTHLARNNFNGSGSLSLQTTPVKTHLDCGRQSFKEPLRYNTTSREQRLNGAKSQQVISHNSRPNYSSNNSSPQPLAQPNSRRVDAATNTELSMHDVLTRDELNKLVDEIRKTYSNMSTTASVSRGDGRSHNNETGNISSSPISDRSSTGSATGPNSSSQPESRSTTSGDERFEGEVDGEISDDNVLKTNSSASAKDISDVCDPKGDYADMSQDGPNQKGDDDEEEEEIEVHLNSIDGAEEAYSLGSSYQDPSDFEEYCAYGESLDRRTKDFLSQTTKIPNDLRFALIRLNDSIKKGRSFGQIESSSNCIDIIRREWFEVAASKDAQAIKTKLYVDFFESFAKQLLNTVINLTDNSGNTAIHYAASHFKLDVIEILLGTKVCDVNCRNKAGYTPIMLLALADLKEPFEQEVARHLFSMGDVNIKARTSGQTALMLAACQNRVATCKLLLDCGADPSLQDFDGSTALMCGSEQGNEEIVRCLLAHRLTDPNATDNDGLDAKTIAMNNGHKNIGLLLYAAKNIPRMTRSATKQSGNPRFAGSAASNYLGASLRRSRGKPEVSQVRRADSLSGQRNTCSAR